MKVNIPDLQSASDDHIRRKRTERERNNYIDATTTQAIFQNMPYSGDRNYVEF